MDNADKSAFAYSSGDFEYPGLSKREYAAIQIMKGIIANEYDPVFDVVKSNFKFSQLESQPGECYAKITALATMIYLTALFEELEKLEYDA